MRRVRFLALPLLVLTLAVLLAPPRNALALPGCQCESADRSTPVLSAKSPNSCSAAENKLYNKLVPYVSCTTAVCLVRIPTVYTVPCYYDAGDAHFHVSGYLAYRCTIGPCSIGSNPFN